MNITTILRRALPCVVLAACGSAQDGAVSLTKITPSAGDSQCATGGQVITTGLDHNNNGVLDADEVTGTAEVCNGASAGVQQLVSTVTLQAGDAHCGYGGVEVDTGLDSGAGGGVAGDGLLQAGEISNRQYVCNDSLPTYLSSVTPPAAPPGSSKIITSGGAGTTARGGSAGRIQAQLRVGTLGGALKVWKTGVVDASFTVPTPVFRAGGQPFAVAADLTLATYDSIALGIASADAHFLVANDPTLYANVAGTATSVTSISVAAGKKLTFSLNFAAQAHAQISLANDLENAGTIVTARMTDAKSAGGLTIYGGAFYGDAGSAIDLSGAAAAGSVGGDGGALVFYMSARTVNRGTITTSGGDGDSGGNAGVLHLNQGNSSPSDCWNTGALTARGGIGSVAAGGNGANLDIESGYQSFGNSGALDSSGGNGVTAGGSAGTQHLTCWYIGETHNTGALTATGGTCTATNCGGGAGAQVTIEGWGGKVVSSGTIDTSGAAGHGTGSGGGGGGVFFGDYDESSYANHVSPVTGSLGVSGNLLAAGGDGASGGRGGTIEFDLDVGGTPVGQEVVLYGYTDLVARGGASVGGVGGGGGSVSLANAVAHPFNNGDGVVVQGPGGGVIEYASIDTRGGDGTFGGFGGSVTMTTQTSYNFSTSYERVASFAASIDTRGGASSGASSNAGRAGRVSLTGVAGVESHSSMLAVGGAASGAGSTGGRGGAFYIESDYGAVVSTAALDNSGGASANGNGGNGGGIQLFGAQVTSSAALTANGGNGASVAGTGGSGGQIQLLSTPTGVSSSTGAMSVVGGTGATTGVKGQILIDGADLTP